MIAIVFCLAIASKLQCREGEPMWNSADSLSEGDKAYSVARDSNSQHSVIERRKLHEERALEICIGSPERVMLFGSVHVKTGHEKTDQAEERTA